MTWQEAADTMLGAENGGFEPGEEAGEGEAVQHAPHQLYIKLDEFNGTTWTERAR